KKPLARINVKPTTLTLSPLPMPVQEISRRPLVTKLKLWRLLQARIQFVRSASPSTGNTPLTRTILDKSGLPRVVQRPAASLPLGRFATTFKATIAHANQPAIDGIMGEPCAEPLSNAPVEISTLAMPESALRILGDNMGKHVIFLGAGASKSSGYPVANELTL